MTTESLVNPYVGPRPFQEGERLYGRRREVDELQDLLYAERVVLLHSPSGAGKSSLVAAGLVPRLRRRFAVLPAIRVHQKPPDGKVNRYAWSALQSLEAGSDTSLVEHLQKRPSEDEPPQRLLVFDQFEEVLSVDPANVEEKRRFFADLGEALADERLWALFIVHEEYVGPLETYRELLPGGLRSTYRLDLLDHEAAAEAMERPARGAGRTFTEAAVRQLVGELAKVQTQDVDGSIRETTGRFIEPVQLQVVCQQLWDAVPPEDLSIDPEDVERFGDVTRALGSYYDDSVAEAGSEERAVREWFERQLIVAGTRAQVLLGRTESGGLSNERIERLRERHLVRAEERAGKTWFELAHDRLIEPVRASNRGWFEAHLHPVQQQARLWASQGRPPGFRLAEENLRTAEEWAKTAELNRDEEDFLCASREAQRNADEIRRQRERALELARAATASSCLASGEATWGSLFALEVRKPEETPTAAAVLHQALASTPELAVVLEGHEGDVYAASFSPDGGRLLTASTDRTARIWDAWSGECLHVLAGHSDVVHRAAWSPDGRLAVTVSHDRTARVWDAATGQVLQVLAGHDGQVVTAVWSSGSRLATASEDRTARIWDPTTGECLHVLAGHTVQVQSVDWNADSTRLVTGSLDKTARIWDTATGQELHVLEGHQDCLNVVAWSADSTRVLTASQDATARVWTAEDGRIDAVLPQKAEDQHAATIFSAAWSGDGTRVATASEDGTARLWETRMGELIHVLKHPGPVLSVAWSRDGTRLLTASRDHKARLWDTWTGKLLDTLSGHTDWVLAAAWSRDGRRAVTVSRDHTARVRGVEPGERLHTLPTPRGPWGRCDPCTRVAWSDDGRRVTTASDTAVHMWDAWTGEPLEAEAGEINPEPEDSALAPAKNPDRSRFLQVEGAEASIRDAAAGELVHVLAGHTDQVLAAAWSHDGRRVLTASKDGTVRLWDAATGEPLHTLVGHSSAVLAAAWSEDDTRILTASKDRTARIWAVGGAEHLQGRIRSETRRTLPASLRRKRLDESDEEARRRAGAREESLPAFFERLEGTARGEVEPYVEAWRAYKDRIEERGSS